MVKSPCCVNVALKKWPWTPKEDQKLLVYVEEHGHGSCRSLLVKTALQRCGKNRGLMWTNCLRPHIKTGKFSLHEEQTSIQLHALRWLAVATQLPKRTDNEIKNNWISKSHIKKRSDKMGIGTVTHKPKVDAFGFNGGQSKDTANFGHIAGWESARLEAKARLLRKSKQLMSNPYFQNKLGFSASAQLTIKVATTPARPQGLGMLEAWQGLDTVILSVSCNRLVSPLDCHHMFLL